MTQEYDTFYKTCTCSAWHEVVPDEESVIKFSYALIKSIINKEKLIIMSSE